MLKSRQISSIISQGLRPLSNETASTINAPLSLSLLSKDGLPLNTVINTQLLPGTDNGNLSIDTLKVYSLLALSQFSSQNSRSITGHELNDWLAMELDINMKCIIQKINTDDNTEEDLYIIIFYGKNFSNAVAKLKLDNVSQALRSGLSGYKRAIKYNDTIYD